jgi:hypothetical protein
MNGMCVSKYIYCELNVMTGEWKIQIGLYTSTFVTVNWLTSTKFRVHSYHHSFGPALHLTIKAGASLAIVILNHLDKVGI